MADNRLSYTAKDYQSIVNELLGTEENNYRDGLVYELTEDWTDFRDSDIGVTLVKMMAMLGDMQNFNIDNELLEHFIETAQQRENIRAILQNLGYKIPGYRSAEISDVEIGIGSGYDENVKIEKYIQISNDGGSVSYLVYEDETILLSPDDQVEVECIQGELIEESKDQDDIDITNRVFLEEKRVAEDTVELEIEGEEWDEVDNVILYAEPGRYFSMHYDDDGDVFIRLYSGWRNFYDPEDVNLDVKYILSDGKDGRIGADKLVSVNSDVFTEGGEEVSGDLEIISHSSSFGGYNPQSNEVAKQEGIELTKTMWTAVTLNDYETLSRNFYGISNALAVDWQIRDDENLGDLEDDWGLETEELAPDEAYYVYVYVVPDEDWLISELDVLEEELSEDLEKKKVATTNIKIKDTYYNDIDIEADVTVRAGVSVDRKSTIEDNIESAVEDYFGKSNREYGEYIRYLDIMRLIEEVSDDIISVDLIQPSDDVELEYVEFPRLDSQIINVE